MSRIAVVAAASLVLLSWSAPNHYRPWTSFHAELAMALALIVAGSWALWHYRAEPRHVPHLALVALAAALIPLAQLQTGVVFFAGDFWIVALYLLGFALAQIIGFRIAAADGIDRVFAFFSWVVLTGSLLSVYIALYQWQQLDYLWIFAEPLPPHGRPGANFAQPNHLATLLVLGLTGIAYLRERARFGGGVTLLLVAFLGFGLAMTQSRAGLLAATLIAGWLLLKRGDLSARLAPKRVLTAYAILLLCVGAWVFVATLSIVPVGRSLAEAATGGVRWVHWSVLLDAVSRKPWSGYGWNQVAFAQATAAPSHPMTGEIVEHSHNLLIDLLVWNGLPLGLLLVGALVWWLWTAVRRARDPATVMAAASVLAVTVHAMFEFPMEYAYFLLPTGLLMGAISASVAPQASLRLPAGLLTVLATAATAVTAVVVMDYLAIEEDMRVIRFEEARIGTQKPRTEPPPTLLLTQLEGFLRFARDHARADMTPAQLDSMRKAVSRYPYSYSTLRYATALALNDQSEKARSALLPICKTHPPSACESARLHWEALGKNEPRIAAIGWPWPKASADSKLQ